MATTTHLMTVEEFSKLPKDNGPVYHELHHGELVSLSRAKFKHLRIQGKLRDLFRNLAGPGSFIEIEVAYRPLPEHELWVADVAYLSRERHQAVDPDDYIQGAPEIVVEVLSPSNTATEMIEKESLCLGNGGREFWVVYPDRRLVRVSTPDGHALTYRSGQEIPLPLFGGAAIAVDAIFP